MLSTTQIVNSYKRTQDSHTVSNNKSATDQQLQAGLQNTSFEKKLGADKGKNFSEIFKEALKR